MLLFVISQYSLHKKYFKEGIHFFPHDSSQGVYVLVMEHWHHFNENGLLFIYTTACMTNTIYINS